MLLRLSLFIGCISLAVVSHADLYVTEHNCSKLTLPEPGSVSKEQASKINKQIDSYKNCILQYIDEQNAALDIHQKNAQSAIDEWNAFVNENGLRKSK